MLLQGSFSYKFTVFVTFAVNSWVEKTDIACHALYWPNMHYANIPHQTAVLHHQALSFWLANQSISPVINLLTPVSLTLASPLFTYINRTNTHQWPYQWYLSYQYTLSQQSIPSIKRIDPFMAFIPFTFLLESCGIFPTFAGSRKNTLGHKFMKFSLLYQRRPQEKYIKQPKLWNKCDFSALTHYSPSIHKSWIPSELASSIHTKT